MKIERLLLCVLPFSFCTRNYYFVLLSLEKIDLKAIKRKDLCYVSLSHWFLFLKIYN